MARGRQGPMRSPTPTWVEGKKAGASFPGVWETHTEREHPSLLFQPLPHFQVMVWLCSVGRERERDGTAGKRLSGGFLSLFSEASRAGCGGRDADIH